MSALGIFGKRRAEQPTQGLNLRPTDDAIGTPLSVPSSRPGFLPPHTCTSLTLNEPTAAQEGPLPDPIPLATKAHKMNLNVEAAS